jgi:hypothetical protein
MRVSSWIASVFFCAACAGPRDDARREGQELVLDPLARPGIVALIFVRTDCPIANRYAPTIRALVKEHEPRGVRFVLVYPDADATPEAIAAHRREYDLPVEALRDPNHEWVARAGVRVTPEVAVFDAEQRLAYRGRIDDRFPLQGVAKSAASVHDLDLALDALERGEAPPASSRPAVGCPIPELARAR